MLCARSVEHGRQLTISRPLKQRARSWYLHGPLLVLPSVVHHCIVYITTRPSLLSGGEHLDHPYHHYFYFADDDVELSWLHFIAPSIDAKTALTMLLHNACSAGRRDITINHALCMIYISIRSKGSNETERSTENSL